MYPNLESAKALVRLPEIKAKRTHSDLKNAAAWQKKVNPFSHLFIQVTESSFEVQGIIRNRPVSRNVIEGVKIRTGDMLAVYHEQISFLDGYARAERDMGAPV